MKRVLITGGSGLVGSRLSELLVEKGYEVAHLGRARNGTEKYVTYLWDIDKGFIEEDAITGSDHIIHLAGANISDGRWTNERKKLIVESRTRSAALLINKLEELKHPLKSFVSASAVGYYGERDDDIIQEDDAPGKGFLADTCVRWEEAARFVTRLGIRLVINRTGIVLSTKGGALPEMEKPLSFGVGTYLGDGRQYYSWIHIDDLCGIYIKSIEDDTMSGIFNAVAPNPVRNKDFVLTLKKVLDTPALIVQAPALALKLALGEMSTVVLESANVSSEKIEDRGFHFKHPWLEDALRDVYARKI